MKKLVILTNHKSLLVNHSRTLNNHLIIYVLKVELLFKMDLQAKSVVHAHYMYNNYDHELSTEHSQLQSHSLEE